MVFFCSVIKIQSHFIGGCMLIGLLLVFVICFSIYLAIEAMKAGMCQRKWFFAAMCLGPLALPMFNMKKRMYFRQLQVQQKAVSARF